MTKFTIIPKLVKVLKVYYSRQCWNGYRERCVQPHRRLIVGRYFVAEHSRTPGLMKGDSFIIEKKDLD